MENNQTIILNNVLSGCDGISCGQLALQRAGIQVNNYFASEIDDKCMKAANSHFPGTVQLGDLNYIDIDSLPDIDLFIAGTPCQNLSRVIIERAAYNTGLKGDKSSLFYRFLEIKNRKQPKYFLLENVIPNKQEDIDIITEALGVEPLLLNSNTVSAQNRARLYWSNIPIQPIATLHPSVLADIIVPADEVPDKYWYDIPYDYNGDDATVQATLHLHNYAMLQRVYNLQVKAPTLTCVTGGHHQKKVWQDGQPRKLMPIEYERLQTLPDNYTEGYGDNTRYSMCGNGWTVAMIEHIFKNIK